MKIIGIDPGTTTGYALAEEGELEVVKSGTAIEAKEFVYNIFAEHDDVIVVIEDARKRSWFGQTGKKRWMGAGSIKRDCSLWEEFCEYFGLPYYLIHPKNIKTKLDAEYFEEVTGWDGQTNEHKRDAGMIAYQFNPEMAGMTS